MQINPAAEPDLANEVLKAVPRYLCVVVDMCLRQIRSHDIHAHLEIRLVKVVGHVPSDLSVLAPLLDDGVEESQDEYEGLIGRMWAVSQLCRVDLEVRAPHVQLESVWGFCYDLYNANIPAVNLRESLFTYNCGSSSNKIKK